MKRSEVISSRLSWSLAGATLLFAAAMALALALFNLWRSGQEDQTAIDQHFQSIESSFVVPIADGLWNYDKSGITLICNGILKQSDVSSVAVFDNGIAIVQLGLAPPGAVSREYPLTRGPDQLGRLIVSIDQQAIHARTVSRFGVSLFYTLILTICIAGFVLLLIERRVMRYLRYAATFVIQRNSNNLAERLLFNRNKIFPGADELDLLATGVSTLQQELSNSIGNLRQDILRRQVAEMALQKSEACFREMFERNASVMLLIAPDSGAIVDANIAASEFYGYSVAQLRSMAIDQINTLPSAATAAARANAAALKENAFVFPHRHASGEIRTVEVRATPIEVDGRVLLFSIIQDITERQIAQDALSESEKRLSAVFHNSPICISVTRFSDGMVLDINEVALSFLGFAYDEIVGHTVADLELFPDEEQREKAARRIRELAHIDCFELRLRKKNREVAIIEYSGSLIDLKGEEYLVGMWMDVTEKVRTEAQLRKLSLAVEQSPVSIVITNLKAEIEYANTAFFQNAGYQPDEIIGQNPRILQSGKTSRETFAALWDALQQGKIWKGELFNQRKDGSEYVESAVIAPILQADGRVSDYVAIKEDITARKASEEQIHALAYFDVLTGLPNRRLLMDRLRQALLSSSRSHKFGALLFIDLDNFKTLNDSLGHDIGDLLLQQVAQRLVTCVREEDTVARLGGDEFVVMLEDLSEDACVAAANAKLVGDKVLAVFGNAYQLAKYPHHSTPSIGITLFSDGSETVDDLLRHGDLAMYQAKAAGRNTLCFFDPRMQSVVASRAQLEDELREALGLGQFLLYYQAQVVGDGRLTGAEVLVRWLHPERGLVSPAVFIPLAEDTGLIVPLGDWVLKTACAQLALWAHHPELNRITLAVNVSPRQFRQTRFVDDVIAALEQTGANPQLLKLELTESLLVDDVEDVIAKMTKLKAVGIGFSLDDFGTGYSSLSYLKRLPLDQLKIDQGFVRDILTDANDAAIAKMVIALADTMGLSVIAEGVEIQAQKEYLARIGCHAYQGYLFSKPLPLDAFEMHIAHLH